MTAESMEFEDAKEAAGERWKKLGGAEMAEIVDHSGDPPAAGRMMILLARRNWMSDAHEILWALYVRARVDTAQELREFIEREEPARLDVFDKYLQLAAEELKIDEEWILGETHASIDFPEMNGDRAFDEARDDGRI